MVVAEPLTVDVVDAPLDAGFVDVDELPRDVKMTINTMTATIPRPLEIKNRRLIFMKLPFERLRHASLAKARPQVWSHYRRQAV